MALTYKEFIDPKQLQKDLAFTEKGVNTSMVDHAGLFASYATKYFQTEQQVLNFKQVLEVTESQADSIIRKRIVEEGGKVTEGLVTKGIPLEKTVMAAQKRYNNAKTQCNLARHAVEAFRQRKDMLIQVASNNREEFKGAVRVFGADNGETPAQQSNRILGMIKKHQEAA